MKRLKFRVGFWMSNGNYYMFYIKAKSHQEASNKGFKKLIKYEPIAEPLSDINEIMVHCVSKEV